MIKMALSAYINFINTMNLSLPNNQFPDTNPTPGVIKLDLGHQWDGRTFNPGLYYSTMT